MRAMLAGRAGPRAAAARSTRSPSPTTSRRRARRRAADTRRRPHSARVCCKPIAAPLRARPAISAAAANARPFQLIANTPVATSDGTSSQSGAPTSSRGHERQRRARERDRPERARCGRRRRPTSVRRRSARRCRRAGSRRARPRPCRRRGRGGRAGRARRSRRRTSAAQRRARCPRRATRRERRAAGAGPSCTTSSSGAPSRSTRPPMTARREAGERRARRTPSGMPRACSIGGSEDRDGEAADRDRGLPDAEREPALRRGEPGHDGAAARRMHARAGETASAKRQAKSAQKLCAWVASRSAPPHAPIPTTSTTRSPKRSAASPHGTSVRTEPRSDAEMRTPVCAEREVVLVAQRRREHGDAEPDRRVRRLGERPGGEDRPAVAARGSTARRGWSAACPCRSRPTSSRDRGRASRPRAHARSPTACSRRTGCRGRRCTAC